MRVIILLSFLAITSFVSGQKSSLFETIHPDSGYSVLVGLPISHESHDSFQRFAFYAYKPDDIARLKKTWHFQNVTPAYLSDQVLNFYIARNKTIVKTGVIYPMNGIISGIFPLTEDLKFKKNLLIEASKVNPISFDVLARSVTSEKEYEGFLDSCKAQPAFLQIFKPDFSFPGYFIVNLPDSGRRLGLDELFRKARVWMDSQVSQTTSRVTYDPTENLNFAQTGVHRITVECSQQSFNAMVKGAFLIDEWQPNIYVAAAFWRIHDPNTKR